MSQTDFAKKLEKNPKRLLSPAEQELFDSEYELSKAGYTANEVNDALTFQKLKNEIIASQDKWDE